MNADVTQVSVISFTENGCRLGERLQKGLEAYGYPVRLYLKSKYGVPQGVQAEPLTEESLSDWTGKRFVDSAALIFIGACGIAVRSIAPYVKSKQTDPAVLVIDETGKFAISLLSGHLGGANELTGQAAEIIGSQAVITTATDRNHRFAVDVFARQNGCVISDMRLAKEVSAALLFGEPVGFYSDFPYDGELPEGLTVGDKEKRPELGICITVRSDRRPFLKTLYLIPKVLTAGIGCRKGTEAAAIRETAEEACRQTGVFAEAIGQVASIDLKKEEPGLLEYCREQGVPFIVYSAEELKRADGVFSESAFVQKITGVENVCERSAVLGSRTEDEGKLLCHKHIGAGVTAALAQKKWSVKF